MLAAGTQIVGGVNARKAGTTVSHVNAAGEAVELPVFATVGEAMAATGADVSVAFVPPAFTKAVSYTHLDVYKRQTWRCLRASCKRFLTSSSSGGNRPARSPVVAARNRAR